MVEGEAPPPPKGGAKAAVQAPDDDELVTVPVQDAAAPFPEGDEMNVPAFEPVPDEDGKTDVQPYDPVPGAPRNAWDYYE